jgi:hypothetical protein
MEIYVVIINNDEKYPEDFETDTCGVFSSLELASRQEIPEGWVLDHIEIWHLDGGYINSIEMVDEEEEE